MNSKITSICLLLITSVYSSSFDDIKKQTLLNNQSLKILKNDIKIIKQDELLSLKWNNIVLGFGMNDVIINDIRNRKKEAMQTQFISIGQTIPLGDKLNIKKTIASTQKTISKLLLDDKKVKYNSLILSYLNQYTIINTRINLFNEYIKNIQKIISLQKQKFKLSNIKQVSIVNNKNLILKAQLQIQSLESKKEILKIKLENISYIKQNNLNHILKDMKIQSINIDNLLQNNNVYLALNKIIKKNKQKVKYESSLKNSNMTINLAYHQRVKYDDYISFSVAFPLSVYGSENIKIQKEKENIFKSKIILKEFKNEFKIKAKTLITNMKIAKLNHDLIISEIIKNNNLIDRLLKSKSVQGSVNTIEQLKNQNEIINKKLQALNEKMKFYKASASLEYYKGTKL